MQQLKCLLIEDEIPSRDDLKFFLEDYEYITIVGEADNGDDGFKLIKEITPDVVFLDVNMPGLSGVEIAKKLKYLVNPPVIIFTTAYSEYAVRAFEFGAVDYLMKPYDANRIHISMERLKERFKLMTDDTRELLSPLERIPAVQGNRTVMIDVDQIIFCSAEAEKIIIHCNHGNFESLNTLHELTDSTKLFRIHRSYAVNLSQIHSIVPWFNGTYQIKLNDIEDTELPVSRSYVKPLKKALGFQCK